MKRSHFFSALLATLVVLGVWLVGRGEERMRAERALDPGGAQERVVTVREPRLTDPGHLLDDVESTRSPAEAVEPAGATRTSTAPGPGPASIRGRLVLPDGDALPAYFAFDDVQLDWRVPSSRRVELHEAGGRYVERETYDGDRYITFADQDGRFEYTGARVGVDLELRIDAGGPVQVLSIEPLSPGERRRLDVELDLGAAVTGWVRDEKGRPVPGVVVQLEDLDPDTEGDVERRSETCTTDEGGRFELRQLRRTVWQPRCWHHELLDAPILDAALGSFPDLELVVRRDGILAGTVRWSDGTPAEVFWLDLGGIARVYQDGRFSVHGLTERTYPLEVRAERGGEFGSLALERVRPDAESLELVLRDQPVHPVRVHVVDERGRPVADCEVRGEGWTRWWHASKDARLAEDGRSFSLDLPPGDWLIHASTPDGVRDHRGVRVGPAGAEVRLELSSTARIDGIVVGPGGDPVAGATVEWDPPVTTDDEGRFSIAPVGRFARLVASAPGYAASEALVLEPPPGRVLDGVVLRLQRACGLVGRVVDPAGRRFSDAYVDVRWGEHCGGADVAADGRFEVEEIGCGVAEVIAKDPATGRRAAATVTVATERPAEDLVLRLAPLDPVRLTVRLSRGGRPVFGGVALRNDAFAVISWMENLGPLQFDVPMPGRCTFWAWEARDDWSDGADLRRIELVIPDRAEHVLEIDLDELPRDSSPEVFDELDW